MGTPVGMTAAQTFTLHDGPPYANGDLHIGHALNKILKVRTHVQQQRLDDGVPSCWQLPGCSLKASALYLLFATARFLGFR